MPGLTAGFSCTTSVIMPLRVLPMRSFATESSACILLRSMPAASKLPPRARIASMAPFGRMWPTAESTTELLMIV